MVQQENIRMCEHWVYTHCHCINTHTQLEYLQYCNTVQWPAKLNRAAGIMHKRFRHQLQNYKNFGKLVKAESEEVLHLVLLPHSKSLGRPRGAFVCVCRLQVLSVYVWVPSGYSDFLPQSKRHAGKVANLNYP